MAKTATRVRSRARRSARIALALAALLGLAALAWAAFATPMARLVYNPSDSVPVGWYRIVPAHALRVGDIVLARLPAEPAALAAQRGYLPSRVALLKRVGAVAPQHVCIADGIVRVDGVPVAAVLRADRQRRSLPIWRHCRRLAGDEVFLLSNTHPASFDSRYFGPVSTSAVIGLAQPFGWRKLP